MSQVARSRSEPDTALPMQTRVVAADSLHNAFTDMVFWQDAFWLAYIASPSHFASPKSRLVLLKSRDAVRWEEAARFNGEGKDIRDPKLGVVQERLTVYALFNRKLDPQPFKTICSQSSDGKAWGPFTHAVQTGWLLGKPQTHDGLTWYAPAHNLELGAVRLFRSLDGIHWENHSVIYEQERADETAIVFTPDGGLLAVTRLESGAGILGSPQCGTLISTARPPYKKWDAQVTSNLTRLDGPALFFHDRIYAVGRFQPETHDPFCQQGSIFGRKRTSIFQVSEKELMHLMDLPSSGDTAYAGAAIQGDSLYISYYTNDPSKDVPWILGMLRPTQIRIARIPLALLADHVQMR